MQLIAKAFLWVHITLYRLTNGRIGGKFIAGSPILLLNHHRAADRQAADPTAHRRPRRRPLRTMRLQRRLPSASWLVPQPVRDRPGRGPGGPRAACRQRQDRRSPERSQLFPRLCRCTRATPTTSKRPAAKSRSWCWPPSTAEHDLTAAGWSVSRNRHTNDAQPPQARLVSPTKSGLASPREGAVVDLVVGSDGKPGYRAAEGGSGLQVTCSQLSVVVRHQPSTTDRRRTSRARASNLHSATRPPLYPLVSS
jgi:hypothetical protein